MIACLLARRLISSENRAVLHTALRHTDYTAFPNEENNVMPQVHAVRKQMRDIVEQVRSGLWRGFKGDAIQNIVNIGIGGSDLGPKLATRALSALQHPGLNFYYVSNLDSAHLAPLIERLDPRTNLVYRCVQDLYHARNQHQCAYCTQLVASGGD